MTAFIDRDGELFKYVLQFLRDGELDVSQLPTGIKQRLKREAAFFCLPKLEEKLGCDVEAKALPGSVLVEVRVAYGKNVEPRFVTQGDPLHLADRFPKIPPSKIFGVLPVILESYHNYHLISVEKDDRSFWVRKVHLNRIVAT